MKRALTITAAALALTACSSIPSEADRADAMTANRALDLMQTRYSFPDATIWTDGTPRSTDTCLDGNSNWIAGCTTQNLANPVRLQGPADSAWAFWKFDLITDRGPAGREVLNWCFGIIPPAGDAELQSYPTDCINVGRPPS